MKLATLEINGQSRIGIVQNDRCLVLCPDQHRVTKDVGSLIASVDAQHALLQLSEQGFAGLESVPLSTVTILAPIANPQKVFCIGTNYADHAREMGGEPPEIPVVFNVFPSAIIGPGESIRLPSISNKVDFEAELVVVIGKPGKHISRESAMDHVYGYCCGNDITARDWQKGKPGGQWLLGKTFDTFSPLGPFVVTRDEVPDPQSLSIELRLNGQIMQHSRTDQLIFSVNDLVVHLSQFVTLMPGDLIFTGTPPGVGAGRKPPVFLQPGDLLEVEIEGLGVLANDVIADS